MASADEIGRLSKAERIAEALRRSIPHLPAEGKAMVESMLDPTMLTIIGGTLLVWIGSHAFGIGEFVDLVLRARAWSPWASQPSTARKLCMTSRHAQSLHGPTQI